MSSDIDRRGLGMADTKIEGFHQIIAVTQSSINFQLKLQHERSPSLSQLDIALPPGPSRPGKKSISRAKISAVMDPMQVQLGVGTENHTVYCYLFLKSGELLYWEDGGYESMSVDNWRIAFKANIDLQAEDVNNLPAHIKKQLQKAGEYSVQKLILDFTIVHPLTDLPRVAADIARYDPDRSLLPGLPNESDELMRHSLLRELFKAWSSHLAKQTDEGQSHNILGYSVSVSQPKEGYPTAPTLVPTSMTHQNYPFLVSTVENPTSDLFGPQKHIGDNNMFLYLEMTNHELLPKVALNYSANWVVNDPDQPVKDGTLAIAKQCFFDSYLLPKLANINRETAIKAIRAEHGGYERDEIHFDFEMGKMYDANADPRLYQWKCTSNPLSWEFGQETFEESHYDSFMTRQLEIYGSLRCQFNNVLEVVPNTNVIRISGSLRVAKVRNANKWNGGNYNYSRNWSITINLDSVEKSGLVAKVEVDPGQPQQGHNSDGHMFASDDAKHAQDLENIINGALNINSVVDDLNSMFNGPWDFYFPGTGVFLLKNPKFNNEGDLLTELSYAESMN
ncbi:hypothetical protein FRC09_015899 [Ceratobasidium sp. 395]|nr:hypothetical protein FRC09_015899 [Ceratobasidium sp. 395]